MITGLVKRRAELAGEIHATHERLGQLVRDLAALDGALAVVAPDMEVEAIRPRMFRPPEDWASRGQMSRLVLTILRQSHDALTTRAMWRSDDPGAGLGRGRPEAAELDGAARRIGTQAPEGQAAGGFQRWAGQLSAMDGCPVGDSGSYGSLVQESRLGL